MEEMKRSPNGIKRDDIDRLDALRYERDYLYDQFTRAAHSRSGTILMRMCAVDKQIAELKRTLREERKRNGGNSK